MARRFQRALTPEELRRRKWKYVGLGCGSGVLLGLVVVLVIFAKLTGGPALPREIRERAAQGASGGGAASPATAAAPGVPGGGAATGPAAGYGGSQAAPLRQQLQYVAQARQSGQQVPVTLTVPDAELNQLIGESMRSRQEIRSAQAYFHDGKVYLVAAVTWQGHDLNLTMVANPVLVNGGMQFALESAHVGSFPAPPAAQEKLRKALNDKQGDWAPAKTGIYFTDIQVREGMAILTGTTTGR